MVRFNPSLDRSWITLESDKAICNLADDTAAGEHLSLHSESDIIGNRLWSWSDYQQEVTSSTFEYSKWDSAISASKWLETPLTHLHHAVGLAVGIALHSGPSGERQGGPWVSSPRKMFQKEEE
ncbi:hypothetical protein B0H10DRAFT_1970771 [Mycena sp. CBHHK59/15]|nr:hypothetical protein B0H10DRAFT_1970771 [Mycena sp. CBHHK59/15]